MKLAQITRYIICFCTILICPANLLAQPQFEHFTIEDGLSNNSVRQIIQDQQGFLWFGTLNGLNRYDGHQIRNYSYDPGHIQGISSIRVNSLYEDQLGYIWITTFQNQLLRFNPSTEQFVHANLIVSGDSSITAELHFLHETSPGVIWIYSETKGLARIKESENPNKYEVTFAGNRTALADSDIEFVYTDKNRALWLSTSNGLVRINSDSVKLVNENIQRFGNKNGSLSPLFTCVTETNDGELLFGTDSAGVHAFNRKKQELIQWMPSLNITAPVNQIREDKKGNILITTSGQGFFCLHKKTGSVRQFSATTSRNQQFDNQYYDIYLDRTGLFWLVSPKRGITMYNPASNNVKYYGLNPDYRESPGDMDRQSILEDSNGDLWIGLYGGGLYKFNRDSYKFDHYSYLNENPKSLSSNLILTLFEDNSKNLWIGTFQGGLNKLQLVQYNFQHTEPAGSTVFKSENEVRSLLQDRLNRLWVGTKDGHIFCYGSSEKQEIIFRIPEDLNLNQRQTYKKSNVYAMLEDQQGNLWIGTKGEGLYRIKGITTSQSLTHQKFDLEVFKHDEEDPTSIAYDHIYALHQDNHGQIWIGTYYGGLDVIENPMDEIVFKHYQHAPGNKTSISDNRVRCIFRDASNNLWIGTSMGLNYLNSTYLNKTNKKFVQYINNPADSNTLSNNEVFSVIQDQAGYIWVATYGGGLNRITRHPNTGAEKFSHFLKKDGLPSNVIFSMLEDQQSNLWLGTDNGLCKFDDENRQIERYTARDGVGDNFYSEGTSIKLASGDLVFGQMNGFVQFNPDSIHLNTKEYPLVLTGFKIFDQRLAPGKPDSPLSKSIENTDQIKLEHNRNFISIEFSVLDFKSPDRIQYSFMLENFEENWNYAANSNQAVYRGLDPGDYIFKVKATNSNGIWMDQIKELNISIAPPLWKTTGAYVLYALIIILLIWLTFYLITNEIKMRNAIKYEKRLTEDKLMFYTNISHELKTPLTLIDNFTSDLLDHPTLPQTIHKKVTSIKKNSIRLIALIEQLLDFRRIQKGKMELKVRQIEIKSFIEEIYSILQPLAEKSNIEFVLTSHFEDQSGWIDPTHIERIVINLLSNALKHTPKNKKVIMDLQIHQKAHHKYLTIKVIDDGDGIHEEHKERIFDRFAFIDKDIYNQFRGSGIGLALSKDLATLHKGTIGVESELNKGSTFTLEIPIDKNAYQAHEFDDSEEIRTPNSELRSVMIDALETEKNETVEMLHARGTSATKSRVLVVEDEEQLRNYMFDKLHTTFEVITAMNGKQGWQMAHDHEPDIIVSDIKMPEMDGFELTQQIKNNFTTSHIPVILLTAKSSMENKIEGLEFGADDYITKPFDMRYLQKRIESLISQRRKLKERFSQDPGFAPEKLTKVPADQKFLNDVTRLIEDNMKDSHYTIESIIEEMGYSRTLFYKKMKGVLGHAPKEFIRSMKMKKAAVLLREPNEGIAQVGYEVGFNDPEYFSKCFKKHFGETPSEYQKKFK